MSKLFFYTSQVVQATCYDHDAVDKVGFPIAVDVTHDAVDLGSTNAVFDTDVFSSNSLVLFFLSGRKFATPGFLLGLLRDGIFRFVALIAGIFPDLTAGGETPVFFVSQLLVVLLAWHGFAEHLDLLGTLVADDGVLDRVAFLLTAVVVLLALGVFGARNRTFAPVNDEFQLRAGSQDFRSTCRPARWQLLAQRRRCWASSR